jgi:bifunctional non-homologous end joining protein LigD
MPRVIQPQLATLVQEPPLGDDWLYEVKLDGYRLICRVENGNVVLRTRAGNDWTERFPHIAAAAAALPVKQAMLDGEVVVLSPQGISDFQALQNMISRQGDADLLYYAFDLPYCGGYDLTEVPLIERKALLSRLINTLPAGGPIRYSDHIQGDGQNVMAHACHSIVEGMVAKRVNSPYEQRRSDQWLKIKCTKRQEFVIGGWTDPGGARKELGALLLGYYNDAGELVYAGRVGTGYTAESLIELRRALDKVAANRPAFAVPPAGSRNAHVHWVEPKIVAEVAFQSWTSDGMVRHAAFQGLREDKPPRDVRRERERTAYSKGSTMGRELKRAPLKIASNADWPFATRLTNPDRVLYPEAGITKRELADYFAAVADWILPHVAGRPLTVVRCPGGIGEGCFFQKHLGEGMPPSLRGIEIQEEKTQGVYLVVDDVEGLIALAQIGALELHPWLCRADKIERPDRLIFDLDPGPGREWADVVDAARLVRARLEDLGLTGFPRTTGGKGMHVVVPLTRTVAWDELKLFARAFATRLERRHPDRFVTTSSKQKRQGKIYIDYLRNERGATAIASYSTRARPGAPVATPLRWDEVRKNLDPMRFNLRTLPKRLAKIAADPWAGMFELKQSLNRATVERLLA